MTTHPEPASFLPLPHLPLHILLALGSSEEMHGYGIIRRIGEILTDVAPPSSGSLYLAILRLEERGLIEAVDPPTSDADRRRQYYRISSLGRRVLSVEMERLSGLIEIARDSALLESSDS